MTATMPALAVPVTGWDATDDEWRADRTRGLGGSDISAVLGFSAYRTPWDVWAEKTGTRSWADDDATAASNLGTALEPWLIGQATLLVGQTVAQTPYRMYAHPVHGWRLCSPDGETADGRLVEAKTAGLASGWGTPKGWDDGAVPLGYEFQCRWSMHVMDRPAVELIALVAGMGLIRRTIWRDLAVEDDMVEQVAAWRAIHIEDGVEPPLGAVDNKALAALYPVPNGKETDLDGTDAEELHAAYLAARDAEKAAKQAKEAAGAALKKILGPDEKGQLGGRTAVTWSSKTGHVDWPRLVAELAAAAGVPMPNPELYRKPATRSLSVKELPR
ncbi:YqaJ viral recombinase family protein [Catenuloplanes indicus]|uniref:Phage-type endonuclease n=1 Tax=Catenuloplanes indicus TaxID=137267 RepID=A0AAE4B3A2_9ACTN|nr:YqaJ viral recombinase family protein [Catenuloplanes indicus]MDQ0371551.1 putative phage-type endonuclease [Catenuloplanes indicus]